MSRPVSVREHTRNRLRIAGVSILFLVVGVYLGFAKDIPFTHQFRVHALFENSANIKSNSPVRIAGVNVGKVIKVGHQGRAGLVDVTFELYEQGLPIYADARAKIRPRIFLEGNFFIDLKPGTAAARRLDDGDTLDVEQTGSLVQLDEVLRVLDSGTREDLKTTLGGYGTALNTKPTPAEDADQDPEARGQTGAESISQAIKTFPRVVRRGGQSADAFLGTQEDDLSRVVAEFGKTARSFNSSAPQLQSMIANLNRVTGTFAADERALRETIRYFSDTAIAAGPALRNVNATLDPLSAFSLNLSTGIVQLPATVEAAGPWIPEVTALLAPAELQGALADLRPTVASFASTVNQATFAVPALDLVARCFGQVVIPAMNTRLDDGEHSSGVENYKEFWYAMVGAAGESQNFDANGGFVRLSPGGGGTVAKSAPSKGNGSSYLSNSVLPQLGVRPALPATRPPLRDDKACYKNAVPDMR